MGGLSAEREISLESGGAAIAGLQRLGVDAVAIDVSHDVAEQLSALRPICALNMLHGSGGEDGVIQGLLETMAIPYTGSGVCASALAMDKVKSKLLWQQLNLSTASFVMLNEDSNWSAVIGTFEQVVVKPVNGGSSLGISIVADAGTLQEGFAKASKYDSKVMAEKYIAGEEFSVSVLGNEVLPIVQLKTKHEFFDFDAKYIAEDTQIICPAELEDEKEKELISLAQAAYESLGCDGLVRVDFMQDKNGRFYILELNTVPGMTEHSFVPAAAKQAGIDFDELLLRILQARRIIQ
jgi:D-alanine-D-alanine ligase|tara:strand:- start:2446 stop:3327 length:882 start_codon:yes stop_codon:yes gene_type:complete